VNFRRNQVVRARRQNSCSSFSECNSCVRGCHKDLTGIEMPSGTQRCESQHHPRPAQDIVLAQFELCSNDKCNSHTSVRPDAECKTDRPKSTLIFWHKFDKAEKSTKQLSCRKLRSLRGGHGAYLQCRPRLWAVKLYGQLVSERNGGLQALWWYARKSAGIRRIFCARICFAKCTRSFVMSEISF